MTSTQAHRETVRLRLFAPKDLAAIHALDLLCFRKGISYSLSEMGGLMRYPSSACLVAEAASGRIAGFAVAQRSFRGGNSKGHIVTIDVDPDFRRRGIGRQLMQGLEAYLVSHGAQLCALEVAVDDAGAQEFYCNLGYRPTARLSGYYMGIVDAIVMKKDLAQSKI